MRVLQELEGEIRPLGFIDMQATMPYCRCDPCYKKESGGRQKCRPWDACQNQMNSDLA